MSETPVKSSKSAAKRRGRAFWPGFSWRVLAHQRTKTGVQSIETYVKQVQLSSDEFDGPVEFDELVIDNWLHLEQMSERNWWMGLGTAEDGRGYEWMINVHVDRDGKATVSMEKGD